MAQTEGLFGALGDRVRLRLACCLLAVKGGLCVCELSDALDIPQPNASRHLRLMKSAGLLEEERDGRWVYYRLAEREHPLLKSICCCIRSVCCCADVKEDARRLDSRLRLRRGGKCVVGFGKR